MYIVKKPENNQNIVNKLRGSLKEQQNQEKGYRVLTPILQPSEDKKSQQERLKNLIKNSLLSNPRLTKNIKSALKIL